MFALRLAIAFACLLPAATAAQSRVVHVLVALCDNKNQGIVKVPAGIGNGQDPAGNLYWGCGYGVKTYFRKQPEWRLVRTQKLPSPGILERLVFRHNTRNAWLVADAYDGARMRQTITDFLNYAAGKQTLQLDSLRAGGAAQLICFVGHNGLMDFSLGETPAPDGPNTRQAAIFACASKPYFTEPLRKAGAWPLIWTTHLMSPEAYTLHAMVTGWLRGDDNARIHEQVAQSYHKYQHCGIRGARRLFATGW